MFNEADRTYSSRKKKEKVAGWRADIRTLQVLFAVLLVDDNNNIHDK